MSFHTWRSDELPSHITRPTAYDQPPQQYSQGDSTQSLGPQTQFNTPSYGYQHPFHIGTPTSYPTSYYNQGTAYPPLAHQAWLDSTHTPVLHTASDSSLVEQRVEGKKRKRNDIDQSYTQPALNQGAPLQQEKALLGIPGYETKRACKQSRHGDTVTLPAKPRSPPWYTIPNCLRCQRSAELIVPCNACGRILYCSPGCQIHDLPTHSAVCLKHKPDEAPSGCSNFSSLINTQSSVQANSPWQDSGYKIESSLKEIPQPMHNTYPSSPYALPMKATGQTPHRVSSSLAPGVSHLSTPPSSSPVHAPTAPAAIISEEPPLCPEQAELVELICSGRNVFYTGSAGCGKSTVLKAFTKRLQHMGKKVRVLAPTGRAALQVGGSTFWTFAGWTPSHLKKTLDELKQTAHGNFVFKRIKLQTDVIVFDEISMIENHNFERLNALMQEAWGNRRAFGGVQVIVTGDFCQLPPVRPFRYCLTCGRELVEGRKNGEKTYKCSQHGEYKDEDKWAFRSKAWQECNFAHVHLKQIHRQNDAEFIRMLQKCRIGDSLSPLEVNKLMDHPCQVNNATRLFATREQVREVNQKMFRKLTGVNHSYWCRDVFYWEQARHPKLQWKGVRKAEGPSGDDELKPLKALEEHRFDERVELKQGMLVVLLINLDLAAGLCNGSQGLICGFEQYDATKVPKARSGKKGEPENKLVGEHASLQEEEIKAFIKSKGARFKRWPVVRFHNGATRVIYADCSISELGDERPYSLLIRTQIPLAPAWAMTIHKSQSLTMDRVIVNLSKAFEKGQVYVALSRATCLKGLKIEGSADALINGLGGNREVQRFLREQFGALNALYG